ncbi:hypothetical protein [Mangrovibacterium diazotrophicum]|uniref:Uncharacterized protein n=1 Tax=Mangrovibacterium diazotrophicum TaxID=1261403 RepID=A0A419VVP7_9BACT|nr:hypothetical protein [Mangrovibacterium diazotrophicum]RKD86205.1 hypothetical protein BC643_4522 [Mangrovibacterium diazotrophicum]
MNKMDIRANATEDSIFGQLKELVRTINYDIQEACSQDDLHITLYHFSKAKSSCLILGELLISIDIFNSDKLNSDFARLNNDMIAMLNNYIHLNRVNIIIDIRRKKK